MKKLSLALIALSLSLVSIGQTAKKTTKTKKTTPKTEKKVEKTETAAKVEETAGLKWYTDLNEAQAAAKKSGKPLMLFFTGSDWCGWCKRLDAEVFSKPEFKTWSDKEVIMLVVDFPRASILSEAQKTQNMKLQQQFAIRGYPTIVFANVSGESDQMALAEKGRTGYLAGGPATWIANANTLIGK